MRLEKLLEKFPPDEAEERWEGYVDGLSWKLREHSLGGWVLFVSIGSLGKDLYLEGILRGSNLQEAIQETVDWLNLFREKLLKLYENMAALAPPSALERVLEDD